MRKRRRHATVAQGTPPARDARERAAAAADRAVPTQSEQALALDLAGQTFGRLTVIARAPTSERGQARWRCRCECGTEKVVRGTDLRHGGTSSCGCLRRENMRKVAAKANASRRAEQGTGPRTHDPEWRARLRGGTGSDLSALINKPDSYGPQARSSKGDAAEREIAELIEARAG